MCTDFFAEVPNELILQIFGKFGLEELLAARRVGRRWRSLVPFAEMGTTRKEMLEFLDILRTSPFFLKTRPWVRANLKPFDREAYVHKLLQQYPSLPGSFKIWVKEWPEQAVIGGIWPGLLRNHYSSPSLTNDMDFMPGINWLSYPQVSLITCVDHSNHAVQHIPGILVSTSERASPTYIIVDERENLNGKIFISGVTRPYLEGFFDETVKLSNSYDRLFPDWITFLRKTWEMLEKEVGIRVEALRPCHQMVRDGFLANHSMHPFADISGMRETAWVRRNELEQQKKS